MAIRTWQHVILQSIPDSETTCLLDACSLQWVFHQGYCQLCGPSFLSAFYALRALPNCLRMDDLSEGPEEIETSVSITRSLWHAQTHKHTKKHKWGHAPKENMYIQACILCTFSIAAPAEFLWLRALCQDLAQYWMYWVTEARSRTALHRGILGLCAKALPPLVQSLDKLFRAIMNEPIEQRAFLVERKQIFLILYKEILF